MEPDNTPTPKSNRSDDANAAANVIRQKLDSLFASEPAAEGEIIDAQQAGKHRSKHQAYMYEISTSGKSLAEIQTAWHEYYVGLPDKEKHEVWQEFYQTHDKSPQAFGPSTHTAAPKAPVHHTPAKHATKKKKATDLRTAADVKNHLLGKISGNGKISKKHHLQSLIFGVGMGAIMLLFLLFGFFNERFIAPFITPSRNVSSTPIIIDPTSSTAVGPEPKIIIPKINVEIPVVYDQPSIKEEDVQRSLENGAVHYANTALPGENGNAVLLGHSSSNLFNNGKYKFAFVLLRRLEVGDTFTLNKNGKQYVYRVSEKKIVKPNDVSVLADTGRPTVTLITCDPPGTSINRLIIIGDQISPDPATNTASSVASSGSTPQPSIVPGNAPSLWSRLVGWLSS